MDGIMAGWNDFFVAEAGASAALAGLLFVAVSINLSRILEFPNLPMRVMETLATLVAALFVASFALVPGQPALAVGCEIAATGAVLLAVNLTTLRADSRHVPATRARWQRRLLRLLNNQSSPPPFIIGGVLLALGRPEGAYWLLPGVLLGFLAALVNTWVLLIEIQR